MHSEDQRPWIEDGMDTLISLAGNTAARELMASRPMEMVLAMEDDR
jgi:hypothetical protein